LMMLLLLLLLLLLLFLHLGVGTKQRKPQHSRMAQQLPGIEGAPQRRY
jgi:hypothetical protein